MNLIHAILLGLIQGLTEFLPVSSTAHLTLAEHLMFHGRAMPLAFDVLLHVGTLLALFVYFRHELIQIFMGCFGRDKEGRRLAIWLFVAMIPTGIFGLATKGIKEAAKEHLWVYGIGLLKPLLKHLPLPADMAFPAGSSSPLLLCIVGVIAAAISGYFAIGLLDRFTRKPKLNGFAISCLGMGLVLVVLGSTGVLGHH